MPVPRRWTETVAGVDYFICSDCGERKSRLEMAASLARVHGVGSYCLACARARAKLADRARARPLPVGEFRAKLPGKRGPKPKPIVLPPKPKRPPIDYGQAGVMCWPRGLDPDTGMARWEVR
jgi:hypothetical protein